jgi:septal ring factor EnvC (AmiA/AmiB activator)
LQSIVGLAGGTLYFEIRVENRPEDPALWLR